MSITPDDRKIVEELFGAALDEEPARRLSFLQERCRDANVRAEVEKLLAEHDEARGFLSAPVVGEPTTQDVLHLANRTIGSYHLLEPIGEGGMGQVWLAEQKEPVRRRVAIKLIKTGMGTIEVVARFESERQALALMDHPAIAKVFDAGSTPEGQPYFVMEYVAGTPITAYCDKHKLTVHERMELFVRVCEGVQHAHQKAIIHRDLKPSNILVTEIDGKPMPRIIDFGVAKATSQKLTAATLYTRVGALIGTVGYMSPEQADPFREDIDPRSDVYSLGAVLYELLAGTLPLDFRKLAFDEVLRLLREEDVPRPSTKVTTLSGESSVIARNRGSDPSTLVRQLRGDPDAIALKALEKERTRRYDSASDMARDIGHYLRSEPVSAHPPGITYRTRKYFRRHRLGLAVAAVAVLATALLVTWWRIPPPVPAVESIVQLTDDGEQKAGIVSDGSRIYFNEGLPGARKIVQVSVTGGPITPVETGLADAELVGIGPNGSALLVIDPNMSAGGEGPVWWIPLPAGEPHRIGSLNATNADLLQDSRIAFINYTPGNDPKGSDTRTHSYIADKDGSNPRELVSYPGYSGEIWGSPNGQRVLLSQELAGNRRLFEIGVNGRGLREIRKLNDTEGQFVWTPDEKYLVYQSGNAPQSDISLLPMQTGLFRHPGKPIRLTNGPIPYTGPYPSRDGKQIFVLGTKQRGELVRYNMQSHEFKPFLPGISATDMTFSQDGKWVSYTSYPDHILWRSRSDGTQRMQLTFPPMNVFCQFLSPDGTKVAFRTDQYDFFVISMKGGTPQKIAGNAFCGPWSPDGHYLYYLVASTAGGGGTIVDIRTGERIPVPSSEHMFGYWLSQNTLIPRNNVTHKFQIFDLRTKKWTDFAAGALGDNVVNWTLSPDRRYLYYTTGGAEPKALRLRLADQRVETITSLKDLHRVADFTIIVAPDGSPIFTRDTGYQEIFALNVRWP
jgi:eukaryotic-like serine/threonine-protein kinase